MCWGWVLALIGCAAAAGCGAEVELSSVGDADAGPEPVLPPDVGPVPQGCSAPRLVPHGYAWHGVFVLAEHGEVLHYACGKSDRAVVRFTVHDVFIDEDETTNACYRNCVDQGACTDPLSVSGKPAWSSPARANFPVIVSVDQAADFCRWRGGRVPTLLELVRASHGGRAHVASSPIYDEFVDCYEAEFEGAWCQQLREHAMGFAGTPVHAVGVVPDDVGPFGHRDLFGSICEHTVTVTNGQPDVCDYPDGALDPGTFGNDPAYRGFMCPAGNLEFNLSVFDIDGLASVFTAVSDPLGHLLYARGVRCAYDPLDTGR